MLILKLYMLLIIALTSLKFFGIYRDFGKSEQAPVNWYLLIAESIPVVIMIFVFVCLLVFLKRFYKFDYLANRKVMFSFLISEIAIMSIIIAYHFVTSADTFNILTRLETIIRIFGVYPMYQSICILFIKANQDPLVGISKLEYLQIVQFFQRQGEEYINKVRQKEEFRKLSEDLKQQFIETIIEDSSNDHSFVEQNTSVEYRDIVQNSISENVYTITQMSQEQGSSFIIQEDYNKSALKDTF